MFTLTETGPEIRGNKVRFRIYLPGIDPGGFTVRVYMISKPGQFDVNIPANVHDLSMQPSGSPGQKLWGDVPKNLWMSEFITMPPGIYLYRFEITRQPPAPGEEVVRSMYFGDPFARETDAGIFSVFRIPASSSFAWHDAAFKVLPLEEIILYELNVAEFGSTFAGVAARIPYFTSLGVKAIELMPVNSIAEPTRWGYMPVFYLAPEERFGGPAGLRELVNACHGAGIAVILDMVYAHTDRMFPYQAAYERFFPLWEDNEYSDASGFHRSPNPMVSAYDDFGKKNDWRLTSTREFFAAVNAFWMKEYHIDGFRYDHVNGYLDHKPVETNGSIDWYSQENRPTFTSLRNLSLSTYQASKSHPRFRFSTNHPSRLVQISEDLGQSAYQLSPVSGSAINGNWEKSLASLARNMAISGTLHPEFGSELLMSDSRYDDLGYTGTKMAGTDQIRTLPVQYIESHDENRLFYLMQNGGVITGDGYDYRNGLDGQPWWKLQPYAIALLTCVGIPMLFAGQEFAENTGVPEGSMARVRGLRPLHWDYFYNAAPSAGDSTVLPLVTLYRNLGKLRAMHPALRSGRDMAKVEFLNESQKTLVYRRWKDNEVILVVLCFSEMPQNISVVFGETGTWTDILDGAYNSPAHSVTVVDPSAEVPVTVPGSFGRIYQISL